MKPKTKTNIVPEVIYSAETWKSDEFSAQLLDLKRPSPTLDCSGRILFYHTLTMEAGKVSIAAALMTAIELHKAKLEHPSEFESWCETNLRHGDIKLGRSTVYRYLAMLQKTIGRNVSLDELVHDTEKGKLEAVATFTKYTNYQSLYQLYHGEEIVKKSNMGGANRGQGRKRKDAAAELADKADEIAAKAGVELVKQLLGDLYVETISKDGFGSFETAEIKSACEMLKQIVKRAEEIVKSRKGK